MNVLVATAIYPRPDRPAFGAFVRTQVESLRRIGVNAEPFILDGRNRKLMYLRAIPRLRRRIRAGDVDLVHAHISYVGAVACAQRRVPIVLTFHGSDLLGTVAHNGQRTLVGDLAVYGGKFVARHVDAVIVQNHAMAGLVRHQHVHVIPCEVDLSTFEPIDRAVARRRLGLDPSRSLVLFASQPDNAVKRFPLAEAAVGILRSRNTSVDLIVAYNEPQDRLALYMNACDALIFPSHQEGSPNVVKQAMACNLPVLATDVGDVAELIADTDGCFVVEPNAEAFADRLEIILRTRMRTRGRERVRHLDCSLIAARLLNVYADVISRRRASGSAKGGCID